MANPYTEVSVSNYNANPPSDDGQQTAGNEILWANHKTKLGDPVKAAIEATQTNITAAFAKRLGNATVTTSSNLTVTTAQDGKIFEATGAVTITLPSSATAGEGFIIGVKSVNTNADAVTITPDGSETIDGFASLTLTAQEILIIQADGTNWTIWFRGFADGALLARGYLAGLVLSNNSTDSEHDIDVAAGEARDDNNAANLRLSTAITKQIDNTWTVGTNQGGLDTGSVAANTWYYVWLIRRSDTGVVDVLFSTSASSPTMPTDYDQKRRIGAVRTDGSSNIRAFHQKGDIFYWATRLAVVSGGSATTEQTASVASVIPSEADSYTLYVNAQQGAGANFTQLRIRIVTGENYYEQVSLGVDGNSNDGGASSGTVDVPNLSQQFFWLWDGTYTGASGSIFVTKYVDRRGKDA